MSVIRFDPEFHDALFGVKRSAQSSGGNAQQAPALRSAAASSPALQQPQNVVRENERYAQMVTRGIRFEDEFKDIFYKERTSASDSLLLIATLPLTGDRVFLKITAKPSDFSKENSSAVEGAVYLNVVDKLIAQHVTPHVLPGVGFFECTGMSSSLYNSDFRTSSDRDEAFDAWRALIHQYDDETVQDTACVLVTQYDDNARSLGDFVSRVASTTSHEAFRTVMCQLLFTLEAFNQSDPPLRHNDLHTGNIMVDTIADGVMTYILSDTEAYAVPTRGCFVRVFDFDWAFAGKHNTKHDPFAGERGFCKEEGKCSEVNPAFDTYYIISLMDRFGRSSYVRTLFPDQVGNSAVYNDPKPFGKSGWSMCHTPPDRMSKKGTTKACDGEIHADELSQLRLPTTRELLATAAEPYRVDIGSVDLLADTTFFVSVDIAQRLRSARGLRNFSFVSKRPIRMPRTCTPADDWPTDFLDGASEIAERMFAILIGWLIEVAQEFKIEKRELAQIVYGFEHIAYYLAQNKMTVARSRVQLIGMVFCAYAWGGEVRTDRWVWLAAGTYTNDEFKTEYEVVSNWMTPPPFCTMYEHLYACGEPAPPGAAHKMLVMAVSPAMYRIPPEDRALFIRGRDMPHVAEMYSRAEAALETANDERTKFVKLNLDVVNPDLSTVFEP
jgi:hypothetical protein